MRRNCRVTLYCRRAVARPGAGRSARRRPIPGRGRAGSASRFAPTTRRSDWPGWAASSTRPRTWSELKPRRLLPQRRADGGVPTAARTGICPIDAQLVSLERPGNGPHSSHPAASAPRLPALLCPRSVACDQSRGGCGRQGAEASAGRLRVPHSAIVAPARTRR